MNISSINNNHLGFRANFECKAEIKKLNSITGEYTPELVNWVKFDRKNLLDVMALTYAARNWDREKFASNIAYRAMLMSETKLENEPCEIYIMTKQDSDFDDLDDSKILGMAEINKEDKNSVELNYIQVDPEQTSLSQRAAYKNIGSKMLDLLKNKYADKVIKLRADAGSVSEFYKKNGFVLKDEKKRYFEWNG